MSKITLKKMSMLNFKGIKNLTIDFDANTNIYGDNGTGKTTIFDAFTWLLFGKNSEDKKDFEIKTLDAKNKVIPKIDHEVYAELGINGDITSIKRVFREKWVKIKGALEAEFSGNETLYYWNEVPLSQKEFQNKVSEILDESIFKLITSPLAFNENLKWQERRSFLVKIAGDISDEELAKGNSDYLELLSQLTNKTLDEYKKQIAATIKKSKEEIKLIPTRIDEVERSKPESVDEKSINELIYQKEKEIEGIDNQLLDKSAAHDEIIKKRNANQEEIFKLKSQLNSIKFDVSEKVKLELSSENSVLENLKVKIQSKEQEELAPAQQKLKRLKTEKEELQSTIDSLDIRINNKRNEWNSENSKQFIFSEENAICPCCNRPFDSIEIEEKRNSLLTNFNTEKQKKLNSISEEGMSLSGKKNSAEKELSELNIRIQKGEDFVKQLTGEIASLRSDFLLEKDKNSDKPTLESIVSKRISESNEYSELLYKISLLENKTFEISENNSQDLKLRKSELQTEIQNLKSSLQANEQIANANKRIADLQVEESKLAQEIANIEKVQYTIENFIKLKVDTIENRINKKFSLVKFKLFEDQINGGQVETCEALVNGVPFSSLNTASKINAGIDIINTLCEFYNVSAPIFIDNRESVVKLLDSNSQIINLIVSESDKKLRIS